LDAVSGVVAFSTSSTVRLVVGDIDVDRFNIAATSTRFVASTPCLCASRHNLSGLMAKLSATALCDVEEGGLGIIAVSLSIAPPAPYGSGSGALLGGRSTLLQIRCVACA
jgi:hypothetical protein